MHLIETETSVDIKEKMSTVEDQVIEKFEVNNPPEITNGHTNSIGNSDNDILKETNKVVATKSIEDIKICKENGVLTTEASQIDIISESYGKVEHTLCIDGEDNQPMTVINDKSVTTNPELNDKCNEDINKDLSNIVSSIANEQSALNDSFDDFSLVFDNDDETLKTDEDTQAVINKQGCKNEEITENAEHKTVDTLENEKMDTDCPVESSVVNITDKGVADDKSNLNSTNLDGKDSILSEVIDPIVTEFVESTNLQTNQPMEIENDIDATKSEAMEVQSEVIETKIDPVTEKRVGAIVNEKVLSVEDLAETNIVADKVETSIITIESNTAFSDIDKTTEEINKPIENLNIDMSEPIPMVIEDQEELADATEPVDNINSENATVNENTIENAIEMDTEKVRETISEDNSEETKANELRPLEIIKKHTQPESVTTDILVNKTIDDFVYATPAIKYNSDIAAVDSSENNTAAENVGSSECKIANTTEIESVDISEENTATKNLDISEENTATKNLDISKKNTAVKTVDISENKTTDKIVDISENKTAAKIVDMSEKNTAAQIVDISENNTAVKIVDISENNTGVKIENISENNTPEKIVDITDKKTVVNIIDSSETKDIDDSKANNDINSEPKTGIISETSNDVSVTKESKNVKAPKKDKTIDADAEIVDISQDKTENEDTCVIIDTDDKKKAVESYETTIEIMDVEDPETTAKPENKSELKELTEIITLDKQETEIIDLDKDTEQKQTEKPGPVVKSTKRTISALSNTLDILSDDDDDDTSKSKSVFDMLLQSNDENSNDKNESSQTDKVTKQDKDTTNEISKQDDKSIALDDDDDVMLIDEDSQDDKTNVDSKIESPVEKKDETQVEKLEEKMEIKEDLPKSPKSEENAVAVETKTEENPAVPEKPKALIPDNFLKTTKKAITDMTREDLEEFCLEKIAEAIIERNNLGEIKTKLKQMLQNVEEWKNKSMILTKQNRDLQIVLKAIEEEMKKRTNAPIKPLKISRSVGMQVLITESDKIPKKRPQPPKPNSTTSSSTGKSNKQINNQSIPVPILVPANGRSPAKPVPQTRQNTNVVKNSNISTTKSPVNKPAEKRPLSVDTACVDLTDDEPPPKQQVTAKNSVQAPVRVVAQHQLMVQRPVMNQSMQGPRKVYIPINSNGPRPGHFVRGVTVTNNMSPRPRTGTNVVRVSNPNMAQTRTLTQVRHPAPLPTITRQPCHPGWKAVPPPPDLKISKVENGIVISWKIEGYQEDSYEEIASYQLFAYQETQSPPSTMLWKKIGDVKALPLPMACTLTQFMAGYKYYFAVRAVDVRKRIGPFSLPGSILLLTGP